MNANAQTAIASYVTDMLALEHHIQKALDGQIASLSDTPSVVTDLQHMHEICSMHIAALEQLAERREQGGQGIAEVVKKAAASVLGLGAAAIDLIRTEELPKNLRDDYAAMSLSCIGYVMLHTTATSLGDSEVADLAERHLADQARSIMTLQDMMPGAVIAFLKSDGLSPREDVLPEIHNTVRGAWSSESLEQRTPSLPMSPEFRGEQATTR